MLHLTLRCSRSVFNRSVIRASPRVGVTAKFTSAPFHWGRGGLRNAGADALVCHKRQSQDTLAPFPSLHLEPKRPRRSHSGPVRKGMS